MCIYNTPRICAEWMQKMMAHALFMFGIDQTYVQEEPAVSCRQTG